MHHNVVHTSNWRPASRGAMVLTTNSSLHAAALGSALLDCIGGKSQQLLRHSDTASILDHSRCCLCQCCLTGASTYQASRIQACFSISMGAATAAATSLISINAVEIFVASAGVLLRTVSIRLRRRPWKVHDFLCLSSLVSRGTGYP